MHIPVIPHDAFHIIRGDLIQGGAKMPALLCYLPTLHHTRFAYVGSVYGSGAWAVAEACAILGYHCTLFLARSDETPRWLPEIDKTGATIHWCDPLPVATLHTTVTQTRPDLYNLPLGFDTPAFIADLAGTMRATIPNRPPELWVPALSGVIARAACLAFPDTPIHAVSAARHHGDIGHAILHTAPEKFHKPAKSPPPFPACPFSCAKIWQFAQKTAVSGAFIWNVGY